MNADLLLKKLEHYSTRYAEHMRSLEFAKKKRKDIKEQVNSLLELTPKYGPSDFKFLEDIAELVVSKLNGFNIFRSKKSTYIHLCS